MAALVLVGVLALVFRREITSQAYLNAGAIRQARRELRVYAGSDFTLRRWMKCAARAIYG